MIGLIPTYQSIGIWAPILLVLCRLMQGFSTGGEWGGAAAFLVEYAPPGRRGLTGSWQQFSTQIGSLTGSVSAALLASSLSDADFYAWGWRIPFLCGFILGPVGYFLRKKVAETPAFERAVEARTVERAPFRVGDPRVSADACCRRSGSASSAASPTSSSSSTWSPTRSIRCTCRRARRSLARSPPARSWWC